MSDLTELFSRDPHKCTKEDIRKIISIMREHAVNYANKVMAPKKAKLTARQETTMKSLGDQNVDL